MKMLYLFLLFLYSLSADINSTLKAEENLEKADQLIENLQSEINWFFKYISPNKTPISSDPEERKLEEELIKKWSDEHAQVVESVNNLQKAFLDFRDKMAEALSIRFTQNQYGTSRYALSTLEITEWYVKYMEENLFPSDWKSLYQKSLQEKQQTTPSLSKR